MSTRVRDWDNVPPRRRCLRAIPVWPCVRGDPAGRDVTVDVVGRPAAPRPADGMTHRRPCLSHSLSPSARRAFPDLPPASGPAMQGRGEWQLEHNLCVITGLVTDRPSAKGRRHTWYRAAPRLCGAGWFGRDQGRLLAARSSPSAALPQLGGESVRGRPGGEECAVVLEPYNVRRR